MGAGVGAHPVQAAGPGRVGLLGSLPIDGEVRLPAQPVIIVQLVFTHSGDWCPGLLQVTVGKGRMQGNADCT